jgi:hypothetical protein
VALRQQDASSATLCFRRRSAVLPLELTCLHADGRRPGQRWSSYDVLLYCLCSPRVMRLGYIRLPRRWGGYHPWRFWGSHIGCQPGEGRTGPSRHGQTHVRQPCRLHGHKVKDTVWGWGRLLHSGDKCWNRAQISSLANAHGPHGNRPRGPACEVPLHRFLDFLQRCGWAAWLTSRRSTRSFVPYQLHHLQNQ